MRRGKDNTKRIFRFIALSSYLCYLKLFVNDNSSCFNYSKIFTEIDRRGDHCVSANCEKEYISISRMNSGMFRQ